MQRDPYEVLGVGRDADETQIKKAFRGMARELHPDVNTDDPEAETKFKECAEAYEILSDADRRATYDRYGHDGLRSGGYAPNFDSFGSIADIFESFFGGGGRQGGPASGGDVATAIELDLEPGGDRRDIRGQLRGGRPVRPLQGQRRRAGDADRDVRPLRRGRPAAGRHADAVRPDDADDRVRRLQRRRPDGIQPVRRVPGPGSAARPAQGQRPGPARDRRRPADPDRRQRPRRRAGGSGRRPPRRRQRAGRRALHPGGRRPDHDRRRLRAARRARCDRRGADARRPDRARGRGRHPAGRRPHAPRPGDAPPAAQRARRPADRRQRRRAPPPHAGTSAGSSRSWRRR